MRRRGCQARKGLPAQPAPPVCPYILQPGKGHRKARGHSRSFKHKYHTDLYYLHRCGAPPQNGEYAADNLKSRPKTAAEYINGIMLYIGNFNHIFRISVYHGKDENSRYSAR